VTAATPLTKVRAWVFFDFCLGMICFVSLRKDGWPTDSRLWGVHPMRCSTEEGFVAAEQRYGRHSLTQRVRLSFSGGAPQPDLMNPAPTKQVGRVARAT
jgi:hypothetical protein